LTKEKPTEKDKTAVYNLGIEVVVAGAIVLVIGVMFQLLGSDVTSRLSSMKDSPDWTGAIAWIFWAAPLCYLSSIITLSAGAYLLHRAYRKIHPKDKRQAQLTSYK
jgi:hypothetical protein